MNIGINGYEAVVPRFGFDEGTGLPIRVGSGEFCYQLLVSLEKTDKKNNYFIYLPKPETSDMPKSTDKWKYIVFKSKKLWTLLGLSNKLYKNTQKLNVFFSPTHYIPISFSSPFVISVLDVSYLHFPQMFEKKDLLLLRWWGKYSIHRAKKIITISESSKNDIIKAYGLPSEKIAVVYPGIKKSSIRQAQDKRIMNQELSSKDLEEKFGINEKYILFVGTLQPRKNIVRLIEAFSKVVQNYSSSERSESRSRFSTSSNNKGLQLVIVGKKGWQYEEILSAPKKFNIEDKVKFIDSVSNDELPSFYKNAEMFVLPSLYEGFGLPILEAMQNDCPVIASNVSSLPEAGGDAALYIDPKDTDDIAKKMEKLLTDDKLKDEMIKKGREQVKKFSWEKAAKETLSVLEEVANA